MIPAERAHLHMAAMTHPGLRNKPNEDRYAVSAHYLSPSDTTPSLLAIVADGVGGHRAGEVAAEMAVETVSRLVAESDGCHPAKTLSQAMIQASKVIYEHAQDDPALTGMGTTCVCAWIIGNRLYSASAGDSRLYLLRNGGIQRLTIDHTWIQEALDHGSLAPEEARSHPNAHIIRRFLGSKHPLHPDQRLHLNAGESDAQAEANQGLRLLPGDRLVLCSDGLTDLVEESEILAALKPGNERETALQGLISLANQRGGHDNITILTLEAPLRMTDSLAVTRAGIQVSTQPTRRLSLPYLLAGGVGMVALLLIAGLGWFFFRPGGLLGPTFTPTVPPALTQPAALTLPAVAGAPVPTASIPSATAIPPTSTTIPVFGQTDQSSALAATHTPWQRNNGAASIAAP
jgi:serine/threonine protein phosphatase PrpC